MALDLHDISNEAELLAAGMPPLMVAAKRVAATVSQGVHGRRRVGQGETFWQYRRYQAGDSMQAIDWRRSAKSDPVYVRETEWEAAQSVWLWADASESMQFRSARDLPDKSYRADLLLLATASLLVRGGEHVAYLGSGMVPTTGRVGLNLMIAAMTGRGGARARRGPSLPAYEALPRYGRVVLIGDFLEPLEEVNATVGAFADRGVGGHILQVLDPAEETLPYGGRTRFEGLESEGRVLIGRVESVRSDYKNLIENHRAGLAAVARAAGWTFGQHVTSQAPQAALLDLYAALSAPRGM